MKGGGCSLAGRASWPLSITWVVERAVTAAMEVTLAGLALGGLLWRALAYRGLHGQHVSGRKAGWPSCAAGLHLRTLPLPCRYPH